MFRLCTVALVARWRPALVTAPAPVYRPPKAPKTPFERMLDGLMKTGKATGPDLAAGGTWTLTVEKVEEKFLKGVVVTYFDGNGKEWSSITANGSCIPIEDAKKGVISMGLYGTYTKPQGDRLNFRRHRTRSEAICQALTSGTLHAACRLPTPILRASLTPSRMRLNGSVKSRCPSSVREQARDGRHVAGETRVARQEPPAVLQGDDERVRRARRLRRAEVDDGDLELAAQVEGVFAGRDDELHRHARLVHERLADQVAAQVRQQGAGVEDALDLVGLHGAGEAEIERPAPGVRHEVRAEPAGPLLEDGQETQVDRSRGHGVPSGRCGTWTTTGFHRHREGGGLERLASTRRANARCRARRPPRRG